MKQIIPSEHDEQVKVIEWCEWNSSKYPELSLIFAIPNMAMRHINNAKKMKAEGLKKGVPDLFLPVVMVEYPKITHGLFIEMKRQKGGTVSKEQKEWIAKLREQGYRVEVCKGADQAIEVIKDYMGIKPAGKTAHKSGYINNQENTNG